MATHLSSVIIAACAFAAAAPAASIRLFVSDWDTNSVYEFNTGLGVLSRTVVPARADGARAMTGMAIGREGSLYLTDFATDAVRRYNPNTGALLDTFVSARSGGLDNCTDLTFGPDGDLYAANGDTGGVLKFNGSTGSFVTTFIPSSACAASRFMLFDNSNVYVTDRSARSVKKFDAATGNLLMEFACCAPEGHGIAITPWRELLVASWSNQTIERFDLATGAHLGTLLTGVYANGIFMGPDGYLYVAEHSRHRIERYDAHTGQLNLVLGEGLLIDPWQFAFLPESSCTGDFNSDGVVDLFDYLDFIDAYSTQNSAADVNADSVIDFFDHLDFISAYAAGC